MVGTPGAAVAVAANHPLGWARARAYSSSSSSSSSLCCCNYQAAAAAAAAARARARARGRVRVRAPSESQKSLLVSQIQLGSLRLPSSSWSGLKHLPPITTPSHSHKEEEEEKKGKVRGKGGVYASLFGVGAPEVLVIGVVALLVFGPKGLAEVARNLGKTLRAFQPTIRELQDVSREFKSTLEREIGLDDIASSTNNTYKPTSFPNENKQPMVDPNGAPKSEAYTSEDLLKVTQEQLAASAASATGPQSQGSSPQEQDVSVDAPSKVSAPTPPESASQIQSSEKA